MKVLLQAGRTGSRRRLPACSLLHTPRAAEKRDLRGRDKVTLTWTAKEMKTKEFMGFKTFTNHTYL